MCLSKINLVSALNVMSWLKFDAFFYFVFNVRSKTKIEIEFQ